MDLIRVLRMYLALVSGVDQQGQVLELVPGSEESCRHSPGPALSGQQRGSG